MRSAETSIEEHEVENEKIMIEQTEKFLKNLSEPGRTRLTSADYSLYLPQLEKIVGDLESKRTGLTPEEDKQKIEELKNLIKSALSPVTEGHYEERACLPFFARRSRGHASFPAFVEFRPGDGSGDCRRRLSAAPHGHSTAACHPVRI